MGWDWTGPESKWSEAQKLASLEPGFRAHVQAVMADMRRQGFNPMLFFAWRSLETQAQKVAEGTSTVSFSFHNALDANGQPAALAADLPDGRKDSKGRLILWGAPWPGEPQGSPYSLERKQKADAHFAALGAAGRARGLYWGGDWTSFKDVAHLQALPNSALGEVKRRSMAVAQRAAQVVSSSAADVSKALTLTLLDPSQGAELARMTATRMPWWGWAAMGGLAFIGVALAVRASRAA